METEGTPKRKAAWWETWAWVIAWIVGLPIALFVAGWGFQFATDILGPGSDIERAAYAERMTGTATGLISARADGRRLVLEPLLDCPQTLPATAQLGMQQVGFRTVRCTDERDGLVIFDLDTPWFSTTGHVVLIGLAAFAIGAFRRRRAARS